jgi:hypothetical protein
MFALIVQTITTQHFSWPVCALSSQPRPAGDLGFSQYPPQSIFSAPAMALKNNQLTSAGVGLECTFRYYMKGKVMNGFQLAAPSQGVPRSRLDPYSDEALAKPWETYTALQNLGSAVWLQKYEMSAHGMTA